MYKYYCMHVINTVPRTNKMKFLKSNNIEYFFIQWWNFYIKHMKDKYLLFNMEQLFPD